MKQIDIYIYTVSHSRGRGPAVFRAVLEFIKADGKPYTLDVNGGDIGGQQSTESRLRQQ